MNKRMRRKKGLLVQKPPEAKLACDAVGKKEKIFKFFALTEQDLQLSLKRLLLVYAYECLVPG